MRIAVAEEMQKVDQLAQERFGLSTPCLDGERWFCCSEAGKEPPSQRRQVVVLAGKGNNGGDGLVAARHLANWGVKVVVVLADKNSREPLTNLEIARRMGLEIIEAKEKRKCEVLLLTSDLVIDGLLGTGISGPPRGWAAELIASLSLPAQALS